jgi:hypothetical protein
MAQHDNEQPNLDFDNVGAINEPIKIIWKEEGVLDAHSGVHTDESAAKRTDH